MVKQKPAPLVHQRKQAGPTRFANNSPPSRRAVCTCWRPPVAGGYHTGSPVFPAYPGGLCYAWVSPYAATSVWRRGCCLVCAARNVEYAAVDPAVNRAAADTVRRIFQLEPSHDLLWGPVVIQKLILDERPQFHVLQQFFPPAFLPALLIPGLRDAWKISAVAGIPPQLSRYGRLAPSQLFGNLCNRVSLCQIK